MIKQETDITSSNSKEADSDHAPVPTIGSNETIGTRPSEEQQKNQATRLEEEMTHHERGMLRWSRTTTLLTFILAVLAAVQAYSFIESERAFLTLGDIHFLDNPPNAGDGGLDFLITIKNSGKHVAQIKTMSIIPKYGIPNKIFHEDSDYRTPNPSLAAPPIIPGGDAQIVGFSKDGPNPPVTRDQMVRGLLNGDIPMWVYGVVTYDLGYPWWRAGELGFCAQFRTERQRRNGALTQFVTCGDELRKYTYTR